MQSYTGILRHVAHTDTAEPPRLALWALEQGKGRWSVHIQSPLVEKKAHQLIDQKVKIQARATISGLIVVAIEPADRA